MPASHHWRLPLALALCLTGGVACGGSHDSAATAAASLPPYTPEAAVLFDDVLAPAVFGFDPEGRVPAHDPRLKERTRQAEFVVPVRVETVSRVGGVANKGAYEVTLEPNGPPLVGAASAEPFVLDVPATSPSYTWVDGAGAGWVGSHLLLFARRYLDGGAPALHFRGEPDTPDLRAAVERDAGLRLLR